jgi:hypothetical protein
MPALVPSIPDPEGSLTEPKSVGDTFLSASLFEDVESKKSRPKKGWKNKSERKTGYSAALFTDKGNTVKGNSEKSPTQGKAKKEK